MCWCCISPGQVLYGVRGPRWAASRSCHLYSHRPSSAGAGASAAASLSSCHLSSRRPRWLCSLLMEKWQLLQLQHPKKSGSNQLASLSFSHILYSSFALPLAPCLSALGTLCAFTFSSAENPSMVLLCKFHAQCSFGRKKNQVKLK